MKNLKMPVRDRAGEHFDDLLQYQGEWVIYSPSNGLLAHHKNYSTNGL
jgi:hypothetical protein